MFQGPLVLCAEAQLVWHGRSDQNGQRRHASRMGTGTKVEEGSGHGVGVQNMDSERSTRVLT